MSKLSLLTDGLIKNNPTFVLVLGMCPTLATTTSAMNGLEMGLATMFVLILSNIVISLIAPVVPDKVHIPVYIVVIATFVTLLQLLMQALPSKTKAEGRLKTIDGSVPRITEKKPGCRFANRCPYAKEICFNENPEAVFVGEGHYCRCHMVGKEEK